MQIVSFKDIDNDLHGFLKDFVFSVKNLTRSEACYLKLTNNIINVLFKYGHISKNNSSIVFSTKERTHINCHLSLYNPKRWDIFVQFHLKTSLELLRNLIENKLHLFFRKEWQQKAFFFKYQRDNLSKFEDICSKLREYISSFIDINLVAISYYSKNKKRYFAINKKHKKALKFFSKTAFIYMSEKDKDLFIKNYREYSLFARKISSQFLCLLFKDNVHPVYLTAISFVMNELLMMFTSMDWIKAEKESEERFRIVADYTADWEYWQDIDGSFLYISPSCFKITGYPPESFYEDPALYEKIIHPEDRKIWLQHKEKAHIPNRKMKDIEVEFRIFRSDGEVRWISHVCNPVCTRGGEFRGFRGSNRDITYRKRLEESLLQKEKLEAVARLAAGIAHDINNLMAMIIGHAELLNLRFSSSSPEKKYASHILEAAERTSNLAEQLLVYAQGGREKYSLLSLNDIVKEVLKFQEDKLGNFEIYISLEKDLWPIKGDKSQISQIIMNIISNSIEAMCETGLLSIYTKNLCLRKALGNIKPGRYVLLKVRDTGCGMDKEVLDKIFDPFFSTKDLGRGLGLSVVYGVVKHLGGYIRVDSSPGKGTIFEIYFPAVIEEDIL